MNCWSTKLSKLPPQPEITTFALLYSLCGGGRICFVLFSSWVDERQPCQLPNTPLNCPQLIFLRSNTDIRANKKEMALMLPAATMFNLMSSHEWPMIGHKRTNYTTPIDTFFVIWGSRGSGLWFLLWAMKMWTVRGHSRPMAPRKQMWTIHATRSVSQCQKKEGSGREECVPGLF